MTNTILAAGIDRPVPAAISKQVGNPVECLPGAILWLPPESETPCSADLGLRSECYNHPVAVLSADKGNVRVLIITSFGGESLAEHHPENPRLRAKYIPIAPSEPHPDNGTLLTLDPDCKRLLRKKSYVNAAEPRTVPLGVLRHYDGNARARSSDYVLSNVSSAFLESHCSRLEARRRLHEFRNSRDADRSVVSSSSPLDVDPCSHLRTPQPLDLLDDDSHAPVAPPVVTPQFVPTPIKRPLIPPPANHLHSLPGAYPPDRLVATPAREAPLLHIGQLSRHGYGTTTPAPPRAWRTDLERQTPRRVAQPRPSTSQSYLGVMGYLLGKLKPERNYKGEYPAVKRIGWALKATGRLLVIAMIVSLFAGLLFCCYWVVMQVFLWLGIGWRAITTLVGSVWDAIRDTWFGIGDTVKGWIEALKELVGRLGGG